MNSPDTINFQSLNMVRDELVATIEQSARHLETFVNAQEDGESLQDCIDGIKQIVGILRLIQFHGACVLAEELYAVATEITPGNHGSLFEKRLEVISNTFFVLTRYLEYVQQVERMVPVLLIPHINSLRKLRNEPAYPESHFFSLNVSRYPKVPAIEKLDLGKKPFVKEVRRLRQMYQVGLLTYIQERNLKNAYALMRRAVIRLHKISGQGKALNLLWWLSNTALRVMGDAKMDGIASRKLLFGRIDRVIRQIELGGKSCFDNPPNPDLIKELIYLITLSGDTSEEVVGIRKHFGVDAFPYNDKDLSKERNALYGPSAHTIMSLVKVLNSELASTKKVLEVAAQSSNQEIDDLDTFIGSLSKVAEILGVVGLVAPSNTLKEQVNNIRSWSKQKEGATPADLLEVANTLLYLESAVSSLENSKLSEETITEANKIAQKEAIASSELAEAARIVVEECEAGILLTKRALSSYADSNYDPNHILNITKTLSTVRGGLLMLKKERASYIVEKCIFFVQDVLMAKEKPAALKELLETYADAVIAIEYYLDSATASLSMDESVLKVAEDALEALGIEMDDNY